MPSLAYRAVRKAFRLIGLVPSEPVSISETSKVRESLAPFCHGDGVDIGYGGDPIVPNAICMDLPDAYAKYKDWPQHLHGRAEDLSWFKDDSLDFVYSSHVLEDFEDTGALLDEWLRVIRPSKNLVLFLPDEQTYREHCKKLGNIPNQHHIHDDFSLDRLKKILAQRDDVEIIHEKFPSAIYSFELVVRKK